MNDTKEPKPAEPELEAAQYRAISMLASGMSVCDAARDCGRAESTVFRWKQAPLFQKALKQEIKIRQSNAIEQQQIQATESFEAQLEALREMRAIMRGGEKIPIYCRLLAQYEILKFGARWNDLARFNAKLKDHRGLYADEPDDPGAPIVPEKCPTRAECGPGDRDQRSPAAIDAMPATAGAYTLEDLQERIRGDRIRRGLEKVDEDDGREPYDEKSDLYHPDRLERLLLEALGDGAPGPQPAESNGAAPASKTPDPSTSPIRPISPIGPISPIEPSAAAPEFDAEFEALPDDEPDPDPEYERDLQETLRTMAEEKEQRKKKWAAEQAAKSVAPTAVKVAPENPPPERKAQREVSRPADPGAAAPRDDRARETQANRVT